MSTKINITPYLCDSLRSAGRSSTFGLTTEDLPFDVIFMFRSSAPKGALPFDVYCAYQSRDGGGDVFIRQRADGLFVRTNGADAVAIDDEACATSDELLPQLVRDGDWGAKLDD